MAVARSSRNEAAGPRTGAEIREAFLAFYEQRGHRRMPSASLVPEDPTVLLTIAGMLPFKPIFLGQQQRPAPCATSSQKCIRTNDIENVGRTARHHTFFEMLGNFSFGDYFKQQAIEWAWELSTVVYGLDPKNLVVSVFREDDEAEQIWRDVVGVNPKRIIRMDEADNFWASGPTGPCGPCSEIYYDFKPELGDEGIDLEDDDRFIEFYNLVFMQSNRDAEGTLTPLANRNIDTGMGLERMAQILQKVPNNYETDLIFPLIEAAADLAGVDYHQLDDKGKTSLKVIGDHSRAVTQLISDGVTASNLGRGYILRRLLRRVVRHGRLLGIDKPFLKSMGEAAIQLMQAVHPQLIERREVILADSFAGFEPLKSGAATETAAALDQIFADEDIHETNDAGGVDDVRLFPRTVVVEPKQTAARLAESTRVEPVRARRRRQSHARAVRCRAYLFPRVTSTFVRVRRAIVQVHLGVSGREGENRKRAGVGVDVSLAPLRRVDDAQRRRCSKALMFPPNDGISRASRVANLDERRRQRRGRRRRAREGVIVFARARHGAKRLVPARVVRRPRFPSSRS